MKLAQRHGANPLSKEASPLARVQSIEPEIRRKTAAILAQPGQKFTGAWGLLNRERTVAADVNLDVVSGLEIERLDYGGWQPDGKAVTPLFYQHFSPR